MVIIKKIFQLALMDAVSQCEKQKTETHCLIKNDKPQIEAKTGNSSRPLRISRKYMP